MAPDAVITERVYASIRQHILSGRFPPGDRLEVKAIAYEEQTSITPVRDAIHRLVGERLLEFQGHGGFQVPILSEAGLRDLYAWHLQLIRLALAVPRPSDPATMITVPEHHGGTSDQIVDATEALFAAMVARSGNRELRLAAAIAGERLRPVRFAELRALSQSQQELEDLRQTISEDDESGCDGAITAYHQRRVDTVAEIVEALRYRNGLP